MKDWVYLFRGLYPFGYKYQVWYQNPPKNSTLICCHAIPFGKIEISIFTHVLSSHTLKLVPCWKQVQNIINELLVRDVCVTSSCWMLSDWNHLKFGYPRSTVYQSMMSLKRIQQMLCNNSVKNSLEGVHFQVAHYNSADSRTNHMDHFDIKGSQSKILYRLSVWEKKMHWIIEESCMFPKSFGSKLIVRQCQHVLVKRIPISQ